MIDLKLYPHFEERIFMIDGANICWHETNKKNRPQIINLKLLISELQSFGVKKDNIKIFCDANLKYYIDNPREYHILVRKKILQETPAGIKADEFILSYCLTHENTLIISNDLFKKYYSQFPNTNWIKEKRIAYMKINNEFIFIPLLEISARRVKNKW